MPARRSKRQQRESDELQALGDLSQQVNVSKDDEEITVQQPAGAGFSALFTPGEEEDVQVETKEDEETPSAPTSPTKTKKKKKKKPASANPSGSPPPSSPQTAGKSRPRKGKEKQADEDGLDQVLENLALKYSQLSSDTSNIKQDTMPSLLSVSLAHLDSEAEMRQFFGSKIVSSNPPPSTKLRRHLGKSNLTHPKPEWAHEMPREGLSIRQLTDDEVKAKFDRHSWSPVVGEKWWTVEYSEQYKAATMVFINACTTGDQNRMFSLPYHFSWHADNRLLLSEIYQQREEYSTAIDNLQRALYTYERALSGAFKLTNGINRLDFDRVENRPFFVAVHRQILDLQRRGCTRAAFEFARLLFSLDPSADPHGASLHLDYLAVKTDLKQWLLDVWEHHHAVWGKEAYRNRLNVTCLPGWSYARALALREIEGDDHTRSHAALTEAIHAFPSIVPLLADKLDLSLPNTIRAKKEYAIHVDGTLEDADCVIHLLSHLYAQRSFSLWKKPDLSKWFADTVITADSRPSSRSDLRTRALEFFGAPIHRTSVWRHVVMQDSSFKSLLAFVRRAAFDRSWFSCDPLPPVETAVSQYNSEFFSGLNAMRPPDMYQNVFEGVEDEAELEMVPEPEGEYENNERQEDGEGTVARENSEEDDDDSEDEATYWLLPLRILRGVADRFRTQIDDNSSSEGDVD